MNGTKANPNEADGQLRCSRVHAQKETTVTPRNIEIIFEVSEDDVDGGYAASALGYGIHTQAETFEEVRENVREAVECYFDDASTRPSVIRLHFVRDEVLAL